MARHHLVRVLPYTPDQLFEMVGDVERYPEFIPWLTSLRTEPARNEGAGVTVLNADAAVGFSFLTERFSTRVRRDAPALRIEATLLSGPFRRLRNEWSFAPHPMGTQVDFDIDFEFKSRLLDALLKANFDRAVNRLVGCFEGRARQLYGAGVSTEAISSPS